MLTSKTLLLYPLLILLFFVASHVYSQNASDQDIVESDWFLEKKISSFQYEGLQIISRSDMNNVLSDYIGKSFSYDILQEIQSVLYELDLFEELTPEARRDPNGELILFFTFIEYPGVSSIKFAGNKKIGVSTLLGKIQLRRNEIVNDRKLKKDLKNLEKYYFDQGYPKAEFRYETKEDPTISNKVIVTFHIKENQRIYITAIDFIGNKLFSQQKLEGIIVSKIKSIFFRGTYSEKQVTDDRRRIEEEYGKNGFLEARVLDVVVNQVPDPENPENTAVQLQFLMQEGEQFMLGDITFSGNTIFPSDELRILFAIKKNELLDISKVRKGYQDVQLEYYNKGFMYNKYNIQETREETNNVMNYSIQIIETGQAHVENIFIRGNIRTKDFVIERELGFEEGDLFSALFINNARKNLLNTRYFKSIIPETKPGSAPGLVDLIFNLEENNTKDIRFGMTFGGSSRFPISLYFSLNQNNLFGRGLVWNNSITASYAEQSIKSTFIEPRLLNSPVLISASLSFSHELIENAPQDIFPPYLDTDNNVVNYDPYSGKYVFSTDRTYKDLTYNAGDPFKGTPNPDEISSLNLMTDRRFYSSYINSVNNNSFMNYDIYQIGASIGSGYTYITPVGNLGAQLNLGPTFSYVYYDKFSYRPANIQTRRNLERWRVFNSLGITLFFDNRDIYYDPSEGFRLKQDFIFVGGLLLGDAHYIKTNTSAEVYFTLFDWKVAENWSWKMVLAAKTAFSSILPQIYYPGGTSFEKDGPTYNQKLRLNGISNARGWYRIYNGEAIWNTWIELRMPLYEGVISWDQIFEVASLWTKREDLFKTDQTKYYFTIGSGFRFVLQQFPLRIYIAKRFSVRNGHLQWQRGNLSSANNSEDTDGVDLIFAISIFN